ncbi:MAG: gliding motility-associated C-terminal domain-containing protein [Saprospiraceae bacterium]
MEAATASLDGSIAEGCLSGTVTFSLPNPASQDFLIDYNVWGTAENGVDIELIPSDLYIPAGQQTLVIPIIAYEDNMAEAPEFIAIDVQRDPCNRDTVYIGIRDNILVPPDLQQDTSVCVGSAPLELDGTLPIPLPDPPSFSNDQDYTIAPTNTAVLSSVNVFGVQPPFLDAGVIRSVCVNLQHPWIDDIDMYLISPGGQFIELTTDNGANGDNYTNTCFTPTAGQIISFPGPFAPATEAPFTGDYLPEGVWEDLWDGDNPTNGIWQLQVLDDANGFTGVLEDWQITFEPAYKINYQWSPGTGLSCTDCPITNVTPQGNTLYELIATDSYGCEVRDSIQIDTLPSILSPDVDCISSDAGSITFGWGSVNNSLSYEVNIDGTGWISASGDTTHTVTGLLPNSTVTIEVRGVNGSLPCPALIGLTSCQNCLSPSLNAVPVAASCVGSGDGSAIVSTDNLNPPYSFDIGSSSNTDGNFANLDAGNYVVTVTDAGGCSAQLPFTVDGPPAIVASTSVQQTISCNGQSDGILQVNANGGIGNLTYLWSAPGSPTTPIVSNLAAGTYTVTITDQNNCTETASLDLNEPAVLDLVLDKEDIDCFGAANGTAFATGSGGTGPYTFNWSNQMLTDTIKNLGSGSYSVTITDANNCQETSVITILEPTAISTTLMPADADCNGNATGTVLHTPGGGTSPYTYLWSDMSAAQNLSNVAAGTYTVTITDNNNCTAVFSTEVGQPQALTLNLSTTPVNCFSGMDGTATAVPGGGVGNFTFQWSNGENTATASGLSAGMATVTITDGNGCTSTNSIEVLQPTELLATSTANDVSCFNSTNGTVDLSPQGGTTPYNYLWSNGAITQNLSNQLPGTYSVTITDANGCTETSQATVSAPPPISSNLAAVPNPCFGDNAGEITMTASGGTPPLNTTWSGPNGFSGSGTNQSSLFAGFYTATTIDSEGCTLIDTITVFEPAELATNLPTVSDTICFEGTNGVAGTIASGGTGPYTYAWDFNNQTGSSISGLIPGVYALTVTDANNCTAVSTTAVVQKGQVFALLEGTDPTCHDGNDGIVAVQVVFYGADEADLNGFNYQWNTTPAQTGVAANHLVSGVNYSVTITDSEGCSTIQSTTLDNPVPMAAEVLATGNVDCAGNSTGWAAVTGSNGQAPYTFFWNALGGNPTDSLLQGLPIGTYPVTVTDSRGCYATTSVTIEQPEDVILSLSSTSVDCFGGSNGTVQVNASGGNSPYSYTWSNGSSAASVDNLTAGVYYLTVSDANGCTYTSDVTVQQPAAALEASATSNPTICFDGNEGSIDLVATGGNPPYQFALNGGTPNGSPIQIGLKAGLYQPVVIDAKGCTLAIPAIEVEQPPAVLIDLGPDITIDLGSGTQLQAILSNAVEPALFMWDRASLDYLSCGDCPDPVVDTLLFAHTFTVYVEDANGCEASDQLTIFVDKPRRIFVPTGFTPNGDFANDKLLVHGQESARILEFQVYDRWGELVYSASDFQPNDTSIGWDGNFRGKPMNPGVYVWVLEAEYLDGTKETFSGNTTLIR